MHSAYKAIPSTTIDLMPLCTPSHLVEVLHGALRWQRIVKLVSGVVFAALGWVGQHLGGEHMG